MAAVYLAQLEGSHGFERWVAVKVIHPHLTGERRFADMLFDEARVAARIHHPNVCAVLDFGEEDGVLYLVMEYLHGESFSSTMRRAWKDGEGMDPWFAARVTLDAAMGLHAAHALTDQDGQTLGVVHRDVSPQNIQVLYEGQSKVVDFGIARAKGRITSTDVGEIKGKLSYMAPEQLRSQPVDYRADVWALGVVLWEATTGRRLFRTDNHATTVMNVVQMDIPAPSSFIADYPPALERAVLGALARDPSARTESAGLLGEELEEFIYSLGRPAGPRQVARWMRVSFADRLSQREAILSDGKGAANGPLPEADLVSEPSVTSHVRGSTQRDAWPTASSASSTDSAATVPLPLPPDSQDSQELQEHQEFLEPEPEPDLDEDVADTRSEIALPEARAGLALAPELGPDDESDDDSVDDYASTVVADPPSDMQWGLVAGLRNPAPTPRGGGFPGGDFGSGIEETTTPDGAAMDGGSPPAPPIVFPGGRPRPPSVPLAGDAGRLLVIGAGVGVAFVLLAVLLILIF